MTDHLLNHTCSIARQFLDTLDTRPVGAHDARHCAASLVRELTDDGCPPREVIENLARQVDDGLVASAGPRFFGFVVGGAHDAALAADWLVSTWDQNAGFYVLSPAVAEIESITASWILDLLALPDDATVGFVTGCQMANFMALAAARQWTLAQAEWDVARDGLIGAPPLRIFTSAESHGTIDRALAMLGLGSRTAERVPCDDQGRIIIDELDAMMRTSDRPTMVCAQAGNVDTGSFDDFNALADLCDTHRAWLHIDGAFGLWAAAAPSLRTHIRGIERAHSWATDAHKWLNVPYDSGIVIVRDRAALMAATNYDGAYLVRTDNKLEPCATTPESSRRARAIPLYAALQELGRAGVTRLIEHSCAMARRAAAQLAAGGAEILNDVVLNQVLVAFPARDGIDEARHMNAVIERIQQDGTCWLGGTTWHGRRAIRISVCNWQTTEAAIDTSVEAILRCVSAETA